MILKIRNSYKFISKSKFTSGGIIMRIKVITIKGKKRVIIKK
jgi:hypothetical protein